MKKEKKCTYCDKKADRIDLTGTPVCEEHKLVFQEIDGLEPPEEEWR
jgi:hypothetical protein